MAADQRVIDAILSLAGHAPANGSRLPRIIGICGAQGSGKSTIAGIVANQLTDRGIATALLSLDDFYLTHAERQVLAATVHPLLATRGVPGTHDVGLALRVLDSLALKSSQCLPRFDKARDDRVPEADQPRFTGPAEIVLFEGWCVGARPQDPSSLITPTNELERAHDPDARWRTFANDALRGDYQALFSRIDRLILLAAPNFAIVQRWRTEQELALQAQLRINGKSTAGTMSEEAITRFIQHYERLTLHILNEMPARADLVVRLDEQRRPTSIQHSANLQVPHDE